VSSDAFTFSRLIFCLLGTARVEYNSGTTFPNAAFKTVLPRDNPLEFLTKWTWAVAHPQGDESGTPQSRVRTGPRPKVTGAIDFLGKPHPKAFFSVLAQIQ
jgi:hypothetical protein